MTNDAPSLPTSPIAEGGVLTPTPRQVWNAVLALALCHNVTPVYDIDRRDVDIDESQSGNTFGSMQNSGFINVTVTG